MAKKTTKQNASSNASEAKQKRTTPASEVHEKNVNGDYSAETGSDMALLDPVQGVEPTYDTLMTKDFVFDPNRVVSDRDNLLQKVAETRRAKKTLQDHRALSEMGVDMEFDPSTTNQRLSIFGKRRNPWLSATADVVDALDALPAVGQPGVVQKLNNVQRALKGLDPMGRPLLRHQVVDLPGLPDVSRNIQQYIYNSLHRTVLLPLGDLSLFSRAQQEKLRTYATLISNRVSTISELNYFDTDAMADILIRTTGEVTGEDLQEIAARRNALIDELRSMTAEAKRRYVVTNILQPLMRTVLIDQFDVTDIPIVDVGDAAHIYAEWERILTHKEFRPNLMTSVAEYLNENLWCRHMFSLQLSVLNGVPHNAFYAIQRINAALGLEDGYNDYTYVASDSENGHQTIEMTAPIGTVTREVVCENVNSEPIVLHDVVDIDPGYSKIDRSEIIALVVELAVLKNFKLAAKIDADLITKYPAWAGLLSEMVTDNGEMLSARAKVSEAFGDIIYHNFLMDVLSATTAENPVSVVFMDASRDTVELNYSGPLGMVSLAKTSYVKTITELLQAIRYSWQWSEDPIWDELTAIGINITPPSETISWLYQRNYIRANNTLVLSDGAVKATSYFFDTELSAADHRIIRLRDILNTCTGGGVMKTHAMGVRRFTTTSITDTDVLRYLGSVPWYFEHLLKNGQLVRLSEIPVDHPMFNRKVKIRALNSSSSHAASKEHAMGLLTNVEPSVYISFRTLEHMQLQPIQFLDDDKYLDKVQLDMLKTYRHFGARHGSDDNSELVFLRMVDPQLFVEVKGLSEFSTMDIPRIYLPTSQHDLLRSLQIHQHDDKDLQTPSVVPTREPQEVADLEDPKLTE